MEKTKSEVDFGQEKLSRREFLKVAAALAGSSLLKLSGADSLMAQELLPKNLVPNPNVTLANLSYIPESLFHHQPNETLNITLNFRTKYSFDTKSHPDHFYTGEKDSYNYQVFQGVKEAIGRGQKVYITIETPGPNEKRVTADDWERYVSSIASSFSGSHFIIGNEINTPYSGWGKNLKKFADYYTFAYDIIKRNSPRSRVIMYGEAYFGDGSTLREVINLLPDKTKMDGFSFHFYDVATKLPARVELYRRLAGEEGVSQDLYLTEIGKAEGVRLTAEQHSDLVAQNLSLAIAQIAEGKIKDAIWFTSYSIDDPGGHSLSEVRPDGSIKTLKPAFETFWTVANMLHHDVSWEEKDGIVIVKGKNSQEQIGVIAWKKDNSVPGVEGKTFFGT